MKKLWFKNKRYGYGWTPASWEGWVVLVVYLLMTIFLFRVVDSVNHSGGDTLIDFYLPFLALTAVLIIICYLTGEKPRWRWGKDD